jgi:RNA polymerase sigma factor (sigma-70 family)
MESTNNKNSRELTEHFFRNEYGKMVSVITRYIGAENVQTAEDIVQETLLKAVDFWQLNGIPKNPQAWLYTTAKNLALNTLKRNKYKQEYEYDAKLSFELSFEEIQFTDEQIEDEQLKMMFVCCHPSISENSQIALILKILCGFSISEIANAFFTSNETINKRLVRGRKQLRENKVSFELPTNINENLTIVLKTIYLLFNEGYNPSQKNELIRYDLCIEAIRLAEITTNLDISEKDESHALLALMYLNASRFEARLSKDNSIIEMEKQNRGKWNLGLIERGIQNLGKAQHNKLSKYLILATISANHCIAKSFDETNWEEILSLYNSLLALEDSPIIRLNRSVALAKVKGNIVAIEELENLELNSDIGKYYLFNTTLAELNKLAGNTEKAVNQFNKALSLTTNKRDADFIKKKLLEIVPIL